MTDRDWQRSKRGTVAGVSFSWFSPRRHFFGGPSCDVVLREALVRIARLWEVF